MTEDFDLVWEKICDNQGNKFLTIRKESFEYKIEDECSIIEIFNPTELHFSALKCRLCTFELSCSFKKLTISYITCSSFTESNIQEPNHFETNSLERLIASIADFINAAGYCCNFMAQYCAFSGCEDKSCLASLYLISKQIWV